MNEVLRIALLKIALQRAFLGRAILIFTNKDNDCEGLMFVFVLFWHLALGL